MINISPTTKDRINRSLAVINFCLIFIYVVIIMGGYNNPREIQTNLLTSSSILTGIIITYLFTKIFQIKAERETRKLKIDELSQKLTAFRKLIHHVITSEEFWPGDDIQKFKSSFNGLTYHDLYSNDSSELAKKYSLGDPLPFSQGKTTLYMAMMELLENKKEIAMWVYDPISKFDYTLDQLRNFLDPSNALWYWLLHQRINWIEDNQVQPRTKEKIIEFSSQIDVRYKVLKIDREFLGNLGSEFQNIYIPILFDLTKKNKSKLPSSFWRIYLALVYVMLSGLLCPLVLLTVKLPDKINYGITVVATCFVIISFLQLLWDLRVLILEETDV